MKSEVNMNKPLREIFMNWLAMRWTVLRAGFSIPLEKGPEADLFTDPDLKRWAEGDPTLSPRARRKYEDPHPGYITRSGQGSLEIGATPEGRIGD